MNHIEAPEKKRYVLIVGDSPSGDQESGTFLTKQDRG